MDILESHYSPNDERVKTCRDLRERLADYRPPLRPRPTAEGNDSSNNKYNRGRDSRFGDDYDRIYIDGGEWQAIWQMNTDEYSGDSTHEHSRYVHHTARRRAHPCREHLI